MTSNKKVEIYEKPQEFMANASRDLMLAVSDRNIQRARHLLSHAAADPNYADLDGVTPIMIASKNHDHEMVCALLVAGASIYPSDNDGYTLDDYAAGRVGQVVEIISMREIVAMLSAAQAKDIKSNDDPQDEETRL